MNKKEIERINYLYHKAKAEGLTKDEQEEQKKLRADYIAAVRNNLRGTLHQVSILEPDGTITEVSKKQKR